MNRRHLFYSLPMILLLMVVVVGWFATDYLGNKARQEIIEESRSSVSILSISLSTTLSKNEEAVKSLAGSPWIAPALLSKGERDIEQANSALDRYGSAFTAISYLMDADGVTVASSNRKDPDSFVGKSYGFRPYFQEAAKGQPGRYFGLGVTSGKRGFYASYPVQNDLGEVVGVVAMKKEIDDIAPYFRNYPYCFFISPDGVIFLSGTPAMVGKSLWPLDKAVRETLLASKQFGNNLSEAVIKKETTDGAEVALEGNDYYVTMKVVDSDGWSIVLLAPTDRIGVYRLIGILVTVLVGSLIIVFSRIIYVTSRSEKALQKSERKFRLLFESMTTGFALHEILRDANGKPVDYRFLQVNPAFEVLTGLIAEDIIGKTALEVMPVLESSWIERYAKVATTGESIQFENYTQSLDRHYQVTAYSPEAERFATIIENITDRKHVEKALQAKTSLLEAQTNATIDGILIVDESQKRVLTNQRIVELFNAPPHIMSDEDDAALLQHVVSLTKHPENFLEKVMYLYDHVTETSHDEVEFKSGMVLDRYSAPVLGKDGEYYGRIWRFRDITDRKRAEEALRESEEKFSKAFQNASYAINITRAEDGTFVEVNEAFTTMTAFTREEALANSAIGLKLWVNEGDRQHAVAELRAGRAVTDQEYQFRTKSGKIIIGLFSAQAIQLSHGRCILSSIGDITEQKVAQEALRESREQYRVLIESQGEGVGIVDLNEVFQFANPAAHQTFGVQTGELVGRNLNEFVSPEDWRATQDHTRERQNGLKSTYELNIVRPDGTHRCLLVTGTPQLDENGVVSGTFGVFRDITNLKRAEEALRESRGVLQAVLNSIPVRVFWKDRNLKFLGCNTPFAQDAGFEKPEDIIGKDDHAMGWRNQADLYRADDLRVIESGNTRLHIEEPQTTPSGEQIHLLTSKVPLRDVNGEIVGVLGTYQDITGHKRMEEEKMELERRLLHGQKLESLGVLAGGIAHDFNNLLAAIIGNLSMVTDDVTELPGVHDAIEQAMLAAERAADLTKQMLAYSGRGHIMVKELNLNELVQENAQLLRAVVPNTVTFDLQLGENLPKIVVDTSQVQQVVMNLITNASEAIGDQAGVITVITGIDNCDETYLSRSRTEQKPEAGMFVWVEVRDTGCGMSVETQKRLFEPFYTTKFTGRGLGMSAVLGIVQGHGGALIIDSETGKGTNMRVLLPTVPGERGDKQPVTPVAKNDVEHVRPSGTVLVVDDEEMIRVLCEAVLHRLGFRTLQAVDGEDAMRVFQAHASEISAVVMDLTMPLMDGATAFKKMLQIKSDVKVILSSGYCEHDATRSLAEFSPAGFLQKPYSLKSLKAELERVLKTIETTGAPVC